MSQASRGYLIALIATFIWSLSGIFISYLTENFIFPVMVLALWRDILACLVLIPAIALIRRDLLVPQPRQIHFLFMYGFLLAVYNVIWTMSVDMNGAAVATVLVYGSAGFTALFAWLLFKEEMNIIKVLAIVCSLCGCVFVAGAYRVELWLINPVGIVTGLMTGFLFAVYSMMGKECARRGMNSWHAMLYSFTFAVLFLFIFNILPISASGNGSIYDILPVLPLQGWIALIILAWVPTIGGYGLYIMSMQILPASIANLIATLEPAMTGILAYMFLGERFTMVQFIGAGMIIGAVVIVRLNEIYGKRNDNHKKAG